MQQFPSDELLMVQRSVANRFVISQVAIAITSGQREEFENGLDIRVHCV